jgi:hypothetical protein
LASASCSEPIAESSEPQRLRPPQFLFAVTTPTEQDGGRPLADEHDVGAAPFGSKSAVFDFDYAFFFASPRVRRNRSTRPRSHSTLNFYHSLQNI